VWCGGKAGCSVVVVVGRTRHPAWENGSAQLAPGNHGGLRVRSCPAAKSVCRVVVRVVRCRGSGVVGPPGAVPQQSACSGTVREVALEPAETPWNSRHVK